MKNIKFLALILLMLSGNILQAGTSTITGISLVSTDGTGGVYYGTLVPSGQTSSTALLNAVNQYASNRSVSTDSFVNAIGASATSLTRPVELTINYTDANGNSQYLVTRGSQVSGAAEILVPSINPIATSSCPSGIPVINNISLESADGSGGVYYSANGNPKPYWNTTGQPLSSSTALLNAVNQYMSSNNISVSTDSVVTASLVGDPASRTNLDRPVILTINFTDENGNSQYLVTEGSDVSGTAQLLVPSICAAGQTLSEGTCSCSSTGTASSTGTGSSASSGAGSPPAPALSPAPAATPTPTSANCYLGTQAVQGLPTNLCDSSNVAKATWKAKNKSCTVQIKNPKKTVSVPASKSMCTKTKIFSTR